MKKLKRFWRTLEEPYGVRGVRAHWRRFLGDEFAAATPFLRKRKEPSEMYPCPRLGGDGCPRRVVVHGPEDIVAVCNCVPKACDTLKLKPADIVEYEFDWKRFCEFLSQLFALATVAEPLPMQKGVWHVGSWAAAAADHRPVFLFASSSRSSFDAAVGAQLITHQAPFVALAPTPRFTGGTALEGLRQRGAALLALEEIVLHSNDGKLVAAGALPELVRGGHSRDTAVEAQGNLFRREQDVWVISFAGKTVRLRHLAGLGYIAELLRSPRVQIEALALTSRSETADSVGDLSPGVDLADETAIGQVQTELEERRTELEQLGSNDWVRRGDLTEEIKQLEDYLRDVQGLRGRTRKAASATERARLAATNNVNRAITRIRAEHPALARHLKDSIRTGVTLAYMPANPTGWEF